jgi:hypothetical protein
MVGAADMKACSIAFLEVRKKAKTAMFGPRSTVYISSEDLRVRTVSELSAIRTEPFRFSMQVDEATAFSPWR